MRSIYANPYKYASQCNIPIALAKIACKKQRHNEKEQRKHPMKCPVCSSKYLMYNHGSYEEGYSDFIECKNCGETFDCNEVPNIEYANLTGFEDFDVVLFFSTYDSITEGWKEACGATTREEWVTFAKKTILGTSQTEISGSTEKGSDEDGSNHI